ncbi:MAG: hypothetical protein IPL79_19045 [Myxococcales bacterium]|nr:hypothetical protein [Myxococcales bacterium]
MKNISLMGTVVVAMMFGGGVYASHLPTRDEGPAIEQFEAIEAALAIKSDNAPTKQPQKDVAPPPLTEPPPGVSRDADAKVPIEPLKDAKPVAKPDLASQYDQFRRASDDAGPASDPSAIGSTDGSDKGWAVANKGDPYNREIAGAAMEFWEYPKILAGADAGAPAGCVVQGADGAISKRRLAETTGNDTLDDAAARALEQFVTKWNEAPKPVPAHLLGGKASREICIRYTL